MAEIDTKLARNITKSGSGADQMLYVVFVAVRWRIYARIVFNIYNNCCFVIVVVCFFNSLAKVVAATKQ